MSKEKTTARQPLKQCQACGGEPCVYEGTSYGSTGESDKYRKVYCSNHICGMQTNLVFFNGLTPIEVQLEIELQWNTRPIEESNAKRIAELEEDNNIKFKLVMSHGEEIVTLKSQNKEQADRIKELEEANEWKPIETAPRDGAHVLLYFVPNEVYMPSKNRVATGYCKRSQFKNCGTGELGEPFYHWESNEKFDGMSYAPTHWKPLNKPKEG